MKKTEYGKKYLITVEDWLKKMNNLEFTKHLEFTKYLNSETGLIVKDIIKEMIEDINTNTSILEEKYTKIKDRLLVTQGKHDAITDRLLDGKHDAITDRLLDGKRNTITDPNYNYRKNKSRLKKEKIKIDGKYII